MDNTKVAGSSPAPYTPRLRTREQMDAHNKRRRDQRRARGLLHGGKKNITQEDFELSREKNKLAARKRYIAKPYSEWENVDKLFWAATRRAKGKGIEFTICKEDIKIPTHCPYLGIPLVPHRKRGDARRDIATLDRIDPTKGYTPDNIEVMSWLANTMKNNASREMLITFAKEVLLRYDNRT